MPQPRDRVRLRARRAALRGSGSFAPRAIEQDARISARAGECLAHAAGCRRDRSPAADDRHPFRFTRHARTVIDAGLGGPCHPW